MSESKYKLGIVGTGNMAEAILRGILNSGLLNADDITAVEKNPQRVAYIKSSYRIAFHPSAPELVKSSKYILISVKPADVPGLMKEIGPFLDFKKNILISIAAGVPIELYESKLPGNIAVIRIMPNTPALLGRGMSVISCGAFVKNRDLGFVKKITGSIGEYAILDEKLQDAVTAISGSGPAYFFLFCKFLIQSALKMGIDKKTAAKLVTSTAIGAGEMLREFKSDADYLIKMVASPGGTTEAALAVFEAEGLDKIIEKAVNHAQQKSLKIQGMLLSQNHQD